MTARRAPGALRRLAGPQPVDVRPAAGGIPAAVHGIPVEAVREDWVVEDRWWTGSPLRRRYLELLLADGRVTTVYRDLVQGGWFEQRA